MMLKWSIAPLLLLLSLGGFSQDKKECYVYSKYGAKKVSATKKVDHFTMDPQYRKSIFLTQELIDHLSTKDGSPKKDDFKLEEAEDPFVALPAKTEG